MELMDKLVALCKRRGFIFPSSDIYGGLNGCWDYGPLGVELKRNIKQAWWEDMIARHDDTLAPAGAPGAFSMVGLDAALLMNPKVWEASGHVGGFSDPMVDCRQTRARYRADQLAVYQVQVEGPDGSAEPLPAPDGLPALFAAVGEVGVTSQQELMAPHAKRVAALIRAMGGRREIRELRAVEGALADDTLRARVFAPGAGEAGTLTAPRAFNLMFKTHVGALEDHSSVAYLRPETAQGIFVNFRHVCDTARVRLPFGIGQIGKAFRNEINPRNFTFRSREFEQMEIEFFCRPDEAAAWYTYWRDRRFRWYLDLGLAPERLHLREHGRDELAHYAAACADVEYQFPFGQSELEGIANRTDFDLGRHMEMSGKDLRYFDDAEPDPDKRRYLAHVIEPSAGADRAALAFLCDAYCEDEIGGEVRTVLKLHPRLAPIKAAVFPLVKKDQMPERALALFRALKRDFNVYYDDKGAIGRRYRRQDEAGTPYCITVDGQTLEDGTVTLRERDSCAQERVATERVADILRARIGAQPG
jgi:glycyl-tRNA synthetase